MDSVDDLLALADRLTRYVDELLKARQQVQADVDPALLPRGFMRRCRAAIRGRSEMVVLVAKELSRCHASSPLPKELIRRVEQELGRADLDPVDLPQGFLLQPLGFFGQGALRALRCREATAELRARARQLPTYPELRASLQVTEPTYPQLLGLVEWHSRRIDILVRDGYRCRQCGADGVEPRGTVLQVHHRYYALGRLPWDYPDDALLALCLGCHTALHASGQVAVYEDAEGKLRPTTLKPCPRCLGAGFFPRWDHVEAGVCFRCRGAMFVSGEGASACGPDA